MMPDKPGWWLLRERETPDKICIVEVERKVGELVFWIPQLDYTAPVTQPRGEWLGPAVLVTDAQWSELRRLRDEARWEASKFDGINDYVTGCRQATATAYETAARLLGRDLPEWRGKEGE